MVSSQSFPHLRTSIRRTTDAPHFINGSANWWVISTHCTSISANFTISRSVAISTLSLRSCITFELLNVLQMICYLLCRALLGLFLIQRSLLSSKPQNGPYLLILQEPLFLMWLDVLVTLFNFFDFLVIGTALLLRMTQKHYLGAFRRFRRLLLLLSFSPWDVFHNCWLYSCQTKHLDEFEMLPTKTVHGRPVWRQDTWK